MRKLLFYSFLLGWQHLFAFSPLQVDSVGKEQAGPRKMNVLFIGVDDLRCLLRCYGDAAAITPNIDKLASEGMIFNRAYCQQAVCNPSRASLMTGRRPNTTKVWDLETHFRKALPDVVTLPQYFKSQGYHTQSVGKIYHDPAWAQDAPSWSAPETSAVTETKGKYALKINLPDTGSWKTSSIENAPVMDDAYIDGQVSRSAIEILNNIKDKPFFLAIGFRRPHLPFSAPEKYWKQYDRNRLPLPQNPSKPLDVPDLALHNSEELRGYRDIPDAGPLTEEKIRELIHGYYASTSYVDAQIGKVIDELDRLGLRENTLIVLWSDHGYHLGEHGLWCKTTNFELDTHVPLIVSYPGSHNNGSHTDAIVELVDLYPTLADLTGLPVPEGLEGSSLKSLLIDPKSRWNKVAFSQFPRLFRKDKTKIMGYSVRTDHFRYTEWREIESGKVVATELYDHRRDPLETKNVSGLKKYAGDIRTLTQQLNKVR